MAIPERAGRISRLRLDESYRHHLQRKKLTALIAGLLLLPVSIVMILSFDRGPMGQAFSEVVGLATDSQPIAQIASDTCRDATFTGHVFDARTNKRLSGVDVSTSFGSSAVTSSDGTFAIPVCYDDAQHAGFSLIFEQTGYRPTRLDVVTGGYPGENFQVADMGLSVIPTATPAPAVAPPQSTRLPASTVESAQAPRPTAAAQPAAPAATPTEAPLQGAGGPYVGGAPPALLPVTGLQEFGLLGQAIGFVLLAISVVLIVTGLWPGGDDSGR